MANSFIALCIIESQKRVAVEGDDTKPEDICGLFLSLGNESKQIN